MEGGIGGQLKSVVSLIDRLRDIKLEQYIQLPKIVVVGSQSSGKSSLIEQIVGLDFLPRGTGVVTRRPLQIRMNYDPNTPQPIASFEEIPGKTLKDFAKVKEAIEELTDKICGKDKNIVDKAIVLKVVSNSSPNLTVIDLPGLTRIALQGQDKDIYKITKQMISRYMGDPSSIILSVVPANQDITNDEVLHMAMGIDQLGERTLACITKIDIMDRGTDARALLLNKGEVPLRLGYIGIKNRSQADIQEGKSVGDSLKAEKMFFSTSPIYSSLPPSCLGTSALVTALTKVLSSNITQFLPELMQQVKQRKQALHETIKEFGRPLPKDEAQEQALLWSVSSQFLNEFKRSLKGHLTALKSKEEISKTSAYLLHLLESTLKEEFENTPEGITSEKVYFAIVKFEAGSLPGFPSIHSFYYLIDPLIKRLRLPLLHVLSEVCETVTKITQSILAEICREFTGYRDHLIEQVSRLIEQARKKSQAFIEQVLQAEENYIYTNSNEFYEEIQTSSKEKTGEDSYVAKNPLVSLLKKRVVAYYKILVKNLRQIIPRNIKRIVLQNAIKEIEFQVFHSSQSDPNTVKEWLKPNQSNYQDRLNKEKEYDVLLKAQQFLLTHPAFSKVRVEDVKKRRAVRQRELKEAEERMAKKKKVQESPISLENKVDTPKGTAKMGPGEKTGPKEVLKQLPKEGPKEVPKEGPKANPEVPKKDGMFQNIFGAKKQPPKKEEIKIQTAKKQEQRKEAKQAPQTEKAPNQNEKAQNKGLFENFFGAKKQEPLKTQPQTPKSLEDEYNKKSGQLADKAVDEVFNNETFKKQSKKAVQNGASSAFQKQLGVSEKTGNTLGKGAGWLFGQQATQNLLKDQAKTNLKEQIQTKK